MSLGRSTLGSISLDADGGIWFRPRSPQDDHGLYYGARGYARAPDALAGLMSDDRSDTIPPRDEAALLAALRAGDEWAFELLERKKTRSIANSP